MEYGPDSITPPDLGFITQIQKVFSIDEVSIPEDNCNLVAVAVRYGLVFCGNGNIVKVFETQSILTDSEPAPKAFFDTGDPITHLSASCDGLTLLVVLLQEDKPKVLFYDTRSLVSGNGCSAFAAKSLNGVRVQAVAWNPRDPTSVALATSPDNLSVITLEDTRLDIKSKAIQARALSWSPKGKQLTVGVADGTLALFKPDLTGVRNVKSPPMDGIGSVQSLTWFSNTEFFIGYKVESEEGGQVLMYVNAPKAQEPRFVVYEYICNDNVGPLPPMFYQTFLQEWNIFCLASSRAAQLGIVGNIGDGSGWCEYELEEGKQAVMHCINITETTYALGMATDFTSQKIFSHKDGSTSGPYPVIYILSTGGELNIFHVVNSKTGVGSLVSPPECLPKTGHRTPHQYHSSSSPLPSALKSAFAPSAGSMFVGSTSGKQTAPGSGFSFGSKPSFENISSSLGGSLFGGKTPQAPLLSFTMQAPPDVTLGGSNTFGTPAPIKVLSSSPGEFSQTSDNKPDTTIKLVPKTLGGSVNQCKQASVSLVSTQAKSQTPSPAPSSPLPKAVAESQQASSKSQSPFAVSTSDTVGNYLEETAVLDVISAAIAQFEDELQSQMAYKTNYEVGSRDDMGLIRRNLSEENEWIEQMSSTTSELMSEVTQLHTKVLQGFKLREEADAHISKRKNPRYFQNKQSRQLDPHSRKCLEDIRSKYQYLKSQLEEVNTQLHLEWVSYLEASKNKKKRDLPVTETIYKALMKCHSLRGKQERDLDILCERLKSFEVNNLSHSLHISRAHNNDDALVTLEKSLKEVQLSSTPLISPVKYMSPSKQEKLQKILSQRTTIPVRKCVESPKLQVVDKLGQSFSFGPQTYSTPARQSKAPLTCHSNSNSEFRSNANGSTGSEYAASDKTSKPSGLFASNTTEKYKHSKPVNMSTTKPVYEDVTPPQTPAVKSDMESKSASPLAALSCLVSKVPTKTTSIDAASLVCLTDSKNSVSEIQGATVSSVGLSSNPISFSLKFPSAAASVGAAVVTSKVSSHDNNTLSLVSKSGTNILPQFTSANLSDKQLLTPSSVTGTQISLAPLSKSAVSTEVSPSNTPGTGQFSFKPSGAKTGLFSLSFPNAISSQTIGSDSSMTKSSFTVVSSNSLSFFGSSLPSSVSVAGASTSAVTSSSFSIHNVKPVGTESVLLSMLSGSSPFSNPTKDIANLVSTGNESSDPKLGSALTVTSVVADNKTSSDKNVSGSMPVKVEKTPVLGGSGSTLFGKSGENGLSASIACGTGTSSPFQITGGNGSVFGGAVTINVVKSNEKTMSNESGFGSSASTTSSIFGTAKVSEAGGIFATGKGSGNGSIFGATSITSVSTLGTTQTKSGNANMVGSSVKGPEEASTVVAASSSGDKNASAIISSTGSILGGISLTSSSSSNIFGSALTTTSAGLKFENTTATTSSASGVFGSVTSSSTNGQSIFGGTSATTTTTSSLFGSLSSPTTVASGGIFGSSAVQTTNSGSVFGGPVTSAAPGTSIFGGSTSSAAPSGGTIFGSVTTAHGVSDGLTMDTGTGFSSLASSPGGSTFGQQSAFGTLPTSSVSSFGTAVNSNTGGSIFGQKSGGIFGQTTQGSSSSLFGGQISTSSVFGGAQSQGGSGFGTSAPKGTSIFGESNATPSGSSPFNPTTTSSSGGGISFGHSSSVASLPFSSTCTTTQSSGSLFSSTSFSLGGSGGGFFSGLGSKPSEENANKNIFGSTSFSGAKPQLSLFGGVTQSSATSFEMGQANTTSFGADHTNTAPAFVSTGFGGTDTTTGSGGSVIQSGFSITTPQKSPAFGGAASFGGSPVFGGSPAFSSSPKFGSSPSFGGTSSFGAMGGGTGTGGTTGGFGGFSSGGGATFGTVASAASPGSGFGSFSGQSSSSTFGEIAQQSPDQTQSPFSTSGNAFGGGSSFSTWR
ncbi:hypothetical protein SK128_011864 [Halocaridina rubra]|uniref:Nuclear pore complex protein Nup214 n=1 Tax=Halocaridina rubra TaxID=373956 RepID=A0AAN8WJW6_HALRR